MTVQTTPMPAPTIPPINNLVPHSASMLLLDRVIAIDEESLQAEVHITRHSLFAEQEGVGSWIGVEYMAQAVAAYAGYHTIGYADAPIGEATENRTKPAKIGFLLGSRRYTAIRGYFAFGSVLRIHVLRLLQGENGLGSFECHIDDGEERIASATLTVFQPPDLKEFLKESAV